MKRHRLRILMSMGCLAMLQSAPSAAASPAEGALVPPSVFLLADPQLHNLHAAQIKQMLLPADWASKVAVRAPELNLLAPLVLRHTLAQRERLGAAQAPTVVLGDATNIGCSGEWDDFKAEMHRGAGRVWLMAHGNHDSYLMGTTNAFVPTASSWVPDGAMATSDLPLDESYFRPRDTPVNAAGSLWNKNWPDACARPAQGEVPSGSPMNKPRWLARYAAVLAQHGLQWAADGAADTSGARIRSTVREGSALASMRFSLRGRWYRAHAGVQEGQFNYSRASRSYVVQSLALGAGHTMVLIDTSVCGLAPLSPGGNAGTNACIGDEQMLDISNILDEASTRGDRLVVGGHYPLKALKAPERAELVALMSAADPRGWTYLSGHTHDAISVTAYAGGTDVNIGSTTDWPMEAHRLQFDPVAASAVSTSLVASVAPVPYAGSSPSQSELCRHLPVARKLAALELDQRVERWNSPRFSDPECKQAQEGWLESARELQRLRETIAQRFDADPALAHLMLRIAAGASRAEAQSWDIAGLIP